MKKNSFINIISFLIILILIFGCLDKQSMPLTYDGKMDITFQVWYDIDSLNDGAKLSSIPVEIFTYAYEGCAYSDSTDSNGIVIFEDIPWSEYNVNINSEIIVDYGTFIDTMPIVAAGIYYPDSSVNTIDTVNILCGGSEKGLKINEIYSVGPPNNFFYFYDQYVELYNSSSEIKYLDGMVFCRMSNTIDNITYIFQFPGEPLVGTEYPVEPGQFVVLAQDAYDHKDLIFNGKVSIDLTVADWEFKNSADLGDWDDPDVPNLENIEVGNHVDFMINLTSDVVILADGSDIDYLDGLDSASIIDGVEYSSSSTHIKDIENFVDRGFGGVGLQKYSGQSLERKTPGFDTDNSTIDFEVIPAPTIGYQHE